MSEMDHSYLCLHGEKPSISASETEKEEGVLFWKQTDILSKSCLLACTRTTKKNLCALFMSFLNRKVNVLVFQ